MKDITITEPAKLIIKTSAISLLLMLLMIYAMHYTLLKPFGWTQSLVFALGWIVATAGILSYGMTGRKKASLIAVAVGFLIVVLFFFLV